MPLVNELQVPIIAAPMAGGPSTPELSDAAWNAGGFGFLAGGMLTASALESHMRETKCPYGVNLFIPHPEPDSMVPLRAYAARHGLDLPTEVDLTDDWDDKWELLLRAARQGWGPKVVSCTFGLFDAADVASLHELGVEAWATIARVDVVDSAVGVGVDTLIIQGPGAGGHRATWTVEEDADSTELPDLVAKISAPVPLVAAGGLSTTEDIAVALSWPGVAAVACGTAFLLAKEAGTGQVHRQMVAGTSSTAVTRAFSGRLARGVETQFMRENTDAPAMYPHVNALMGPLRKQSAAARDPRHVAAWAGTGFRHARAASAQEIIAELYPRLG